jgi:hypothetical protein
MKKLESLYLMNYQGVNLPNSIGEFQNLRSLCLTACDQLKEFPKFPTLEIGSESTHGIFPMLENMELRDLAKLESIISLSNMWNEGTMFKLESLHIENCFFADKLLFGVEKLSNLTSLIIGSCNELMKLDLSSGGFPMLTYLGLYSLTKLESMTGPFGTWNEETLPKLQVLIIRDCPLLRRLTLGMEKLLCLKIIRGELTWWDQIIWEDEFMKNSLFQHFRVLKDCD